ncbi:MAG: hypothetical protein K0Q63_3751, partial [Paenibacillus sp.]|nr:hypothetical protein [Paenibacillus sp.]
ISASLICVCAQLNMSHFRMDFNTELPTLCRISFHYNVIRSANAPFPAYALAFSATTPA